MSIVNRFFTTPISLCALWGACFCDSHTSLLLAGQVVQLAADTETEATAEEFAAHWLRQRPIDGLPIGRAIGILVNPRFSEDTRIAMCSLSLMYAQSAENRELVNEVAVEFLAMDGDRISKAASINFATYGMKNPEEVERRIIEEIFDPLVPDESARSGCVLLLQLSLVSKSISPTLEGILDKVASSSLFDSRRALLLEGICQGLPPFEIVEMSVSVDCWKHLGQVCDKIYCDRMQPEKVRSACANILGHPFVIKSCPVSTTAAGAASEIFRSSESSVHARECSARLLASLNSVDADVVLVARDVVASFSDAEVGTNRITTPCLRLISMATQPGDEDRALFCRILMARGVQSGQRDIIEAALRKWGSFPQCSFTN